VAGFIMSASPVRIDADGHGLGPTAFGRRRIAMDDEPQDGRKASTGSGDGGAWHAIDLTDPRAITILTAEHASLVASRGLADNEGFVRTGMFLTALSASLVALGFVAQALAFGDGFDVFAVLVLGLVFVLGLTTLIRVAETAREDLLAVQGMNRIRRAYFDICAAVMPYFSTSDRDDLEGVTATYQGPPEGSSMTGAASMVHGFGTAVGMVGLVVSLVGAALAGVLAGMLGASVLGAVVNRRRGVRAPAGSDHGARRAIGGRVRCRPRGPLPYGIGRGPRVRREDRRALTSAPCPPSSRSPSSCCASRAVLMTARRA
jgi:hypothetical protein